MEKAQFNLNKYHFDKINLDMENYDGSGLFVGIEPHGVFSSESSEYNLTFDFYAYSNDKEDKKAFLNIRCVSVFKFENVSDVDSIPNYFYRNSIAILFPYLRAFISIVTMQANTPPIILPLMNLSSLEGTLRENTKVI